MEDKILLGHGSGGKLSHDLVEQDFVPILQNPLLEKLDAVWPLPPIVMW